MYNQKISKLDIPRTARLRFFHNITGSYQKGADVKMSHRKRFMEKTGAHIGLADMLLLSPGDRVLSYENVVYSNGEPREYTIVRVFPQFGHHYEGCALRVLPVIRRRDDEGNEDSISAIAVVKVLSRPSRLSVPSNYFRQGYMGDDPFGHVRTSIKNIWRGSFGDLVRRVLWGMINYDIPTDLAEWRAEQLWEDQGFPGLKQFVRYIDTIECVVSAKPFTAWVRRNWRRLIMTNAERDNWYTENVHDPAHFDLMSTMDGVIESEDPLFEEFLNIWDVDHTDHEADYCEGDFECIEDDALDAYDEDLDDL